MKVKQKGRGEAVARVLRLLELLRGGRRTLQELAAFLSVTTRTVRRDFDIVRDLSADYGWTLESVYLDEGRGFGTRVYWLS